MTKIGFCLPQRDLSLALWRTSVTNLATSLSNEHGFQVAGYEQTGNSLLEQARSMVATEALDDGCDVLLWADDDVTFGSDASRLVLGALQKETMVAAVMPVRDGTKLNAEFEIPEGESINVKFLEHGGLYPINFAGMALTAVHRCVYERMGSLMTRHMMVAGVKTAFPFYRSLIKDIENGIPKRWYGEDVSFCIRARELGFRLWADTYVEAYHHTRKAWSVRDLYQAACLK